MVISELEKMTKETISCNAAADVIGCNPQLLRIQARECSKALGFPVIVVGKRVKIPRLAFIAYMRGSGNQVTTGT